MPPQLLLVVLVPVSVSCVRMMTWRLWDHMAIIICCPRSTALQNQENACLAEWSGRFVRAGSQGVDTFNQLHVACIKRRIRRIREQHFVHINSVLPFTLLELEGALLGVDKIAYEAFCVLCPGGGMPSFIFTCAEVSAASHPCGSTDLSFRCLKLLPPLIVMVIVPSL